MSQGNGQSLLGGGVPLLLGPQKEFRCKDGHSYKAQEGIRLVMMFGLLVGGQFQPVGNVKNTSGAVCPVCVMRFWQENFGVNEVLLGEADRP